MVSRVAVISLIALICLAGTAYAWQVENAEFYPSENKIKIKFDLNPLESILAFFLGGEYTVKLTENFVSGSYEIVKADFQSAVIQINGTVYFKEPVNIEIVKDNVSYYLYSVKELNASEIR